MLLVANAWIFVLVPCAVGVILVITMRLLAKKRIRNHLATHSILSDEEFLSGLKLTAKQFDMCLAIRRTVANILESTSGDIIPIRFYGQVR